MLEKVVKEISSSVTTREDSDDMMGMLSLVSPDVLARY